MLCSGVFLPMAAAVAGYLIGRVDKGMRDYFADVVTGLIFGLFLYLAIQSFSGRAISAEIPGICGFGLHFVLDGFRGLYGTIAAFMWFMSTLFSREYLNLYRNRNRYYLFLLLTLGATEGVFLASDFFTFFLFFEIMSFTSYVWVAHDETKASLRAAETYLAVAVIGGLSMLMGIFLLYRETGTLQFQELTNLLAKYQQVLSVDPSVPGGTRTVWIAGLCMLVGFGAKAGAFPLHIWLPKAHPVAPATTSALLSGILTKAGMLGILVLTGSIFLGSSTWGALILMIGVCTMVLGSVLALFSIDLKRTLACSSVSQIGFILVGVGMSGLLGEENALAVRGSLLHMVNHSLIKLTLFMAAGVVFMNVRKLDLNEIRGFGRKKPLLNFIFLMGALGIGGVPFWNGYISKTLIHESIVEYRELVISGAAAGMFAGSAMEMIEWAFLISGGFTAAYMAKLYIALFVEKNRDKEVQEKYDFLKGQYMNKVSAFALTLSAVLLPLLGFMPGITMDFLANMGQGILNPTQEVSSAAYFSLENLKGAAISLVIGALLYFLIVRLWMMKKEGEEKVYVNRWYRYFDLEDFVYRPVLQKALPFVLGVLCRILDSLTDTVVVALRKTIFKDSPLPHELEEGNVLTHAAGHFADKVQNIVNELFRKKKPKRVDHAHRYAVIYGQWSENITIIARSLSFGLILFCVGLIATVVYLLLY